MKLTDKPSTAPITIPVTEAVTFSGIRRTSLYKYLDSGKLAAVKSGRRTLVRVDSLRHLIDTLPAYLGKG